MTRKLFVMGSALGIIAMTFSNHAFAFSCESSFARQIGVPRQAGAFSTALAMQDQHNEESPRMKPVSVSGSEIDGDANRRGFLSQTSKGVLLGMGGATAGWNPIGPPSASANPSTQSRTTGYKVQQTEAEWKDMLSPLQYTILRDGGTESPFTSILESEKREGTFVCAGCGTPLFASQDKFNSGTGWPSFARGLGDGVEVQQVNAIQKNLGGAELRCHTCGGHLGDVFQDGWIFTGTEAAKTGERYCIDGAALVFVPTDTSLSPLSGDLPRSKQASA